MDIFLLIHAIIITLVNMFTIGVIIIFKVMAITAPLLILVTRSQLRKQYNESIQETIETDDSTNNE